MSRAELTVDELAARVGMTVRNVRAYASRGLLPPPRLVGRTGYYGEEHVARLQLVLDMVNRGYTLNAVEKALSENTVADSHALDLLTLLANPMGQAQQTEVISWDALTKLAGVSKDELFMTQLMELGLLEWVDDENVRLLQPVLVRSGAAAMNLGMKRPTVLKLFAALTTSLDTVATAFVDAFRDDVWHAFVEAGMPEEQWADIVRSIESLLPIASQAVIAAFRERLVQTIDEVVGEELEHLTGEQLSTFLGS